MGPPFRRIKKQCVCTRDRHTGKEDANSSGLGKVIVTPGQMRREFLLRIEDPPLHGANGDGFCRGNLVVFPLFNESQPHHIALPRIKEAHPTLEFEGRRAGWAVIARCCEAVRDVRQIDGFQFARLAITVVSAHNVERDLEHPATERSGISELADLAVHGDHHFLRQVFGEREVTTARTEKRDELAGEAMKERLEGLFAWRVKEFFYDNKVL